jgi:phage terminase large subunit-like protein
VLFLELCAKGKEIAQEWRTPLKIENAHLGPAMYETLRSQGVQCELLPTVTEDMKGESGSPGKVERATPLFRKLQAGEVFFPKYENTWMPAYTGELISWTGLPDEAADQVDVSSYACNYCESLSGGGAQVPIVYPGVGRITGTQPLGFGWR